MKTKSSVSYNNVFLHDLDDSIVVQKITEKGASLSRSETAMANGMGSFAGRQKRSPLDITIEFAIRMKAPNAEAENARREVIEKVDLWARGTDPDINHYMSIGSRTGQRLLCRLLQTYSPGVARTWNGTYAITFRASEVPYWQDVNAVTLESNVTSTARTVQMTATGTSKTPLRFSFENTNTTAIRELTVSVNGRSMRFATMNIEPGEKLVVDRIATNGIQRIRVQGTSGSYTNAYERITLDSDDDLWLNPGVNDISLVSTRAGRITLSCVGRFS